MKDKVGILSLGCPRNLVDSETILGRLNLKGYSIVEIEKADIAILNTCAFIDSAKKESVEAILDLIDLKKEGRLKKIIVYGCLTQRYRVQLQKELPQVDAFVGCISLNHNSQRFSLTPRHFAYLKICEGCINHCSYCVIPKIKSGFVSLDLDPLLKKAVQLDRLETQELNLVGQDITGWGMDLFSRPQLPKVIKEILKKTKNIKWIRLLYLYPARVSDELIELIADEERLCKYLDLPLQHINDRILKLMYRKTPKKEIMRLIEKIRKKIPQAALRTSLIVGFPSERDEEFQELLDFISEVKFERLGAFIYSPEEGSPAYTFKPQIPQRVKLSRFNALMSRQQKIAREVNAKFLGKIMDVLLDEQEDSVYLGRSQYDAPEVDGLIFVRSRRKLKPGEMIKAKITDTLEYDLVGEELQDECGK